MEPHIMLPASLNTENIWGIANLTLAALCLGLLFWSLYNFFKIRQLKRSWNKLMRSFQDLDEQAKLIVKTDLELNKTQEELDRRLNSLNTLQKTSRLISTTLDEDEIFRRLDQPLMSELGFEKNLILIIDQQKKLHCQVSTGFSQQEILFVLSSLEKDNNFLTALREGHSYSSVRSPQTMKEKIIQIFNVAHFILLPILSQDGMVGILFVGNRTAATTITEGDEELFSILSNQIGQSLENARLFEQVYKSRQELEFKIQERTRQLASALEEVKKMNKTKSEFISAVSHELRTPLTSIKGYASILMTGKLGNIPAAVSERLEKINKHSDNLVKLINDLLDISRIESGRSEMKFTQYNLSQLVEGVKDLLTPQLKEKSIQMTTQIPEDLPWVEIDVSQIERVFINLIGNAIKFTPAQGSITIKAQAASHEVTCSISDTGIGISEDNIVKLFNEFYRVDNEINQNVKGTGLGLALAKKIVEAHRGKIWVTSRLNQGTTFHFTLPTRKIESA